MNKKRILEYLIEMHGFDRLGQFMPGRMFHCGLNLSRCLHDAQCVMPDFGVDL